MAAILATAGIVTIVGLFLYAARPTAEVVVCRTCGHQGPADADPEHLRCGACGSAEVFPVPRGHG